MIRFGDEAATALPASIVLQMIASFTVAMAGDTL